MPLKSWLWSLKRALDVKSLGEWEVINWRKTSGKDWSCLMASPLEYRWDWESFCRFSYAFNNENLPIARQIISDGAGPISTYFLFWLWVIWIRSSKALITRIKLSKALIDTLFRITAWRVLLFLHSCMGASFCVIELLSRSIPSLVIKEFVFISSINFRYYFQFHYFFIK